MAVHLPAEDPFWVTLDGQMWAVAAVILANVLTLLTLGGQRAEHENRPGPDEVFLRVAPRVSGAIFLATAGYFLFVTWLEADYRRTAPFRLIVGANALVLAAVAAKTGVLFTGGTEAEAEADEEQ